MSYQSLSTDLTTLANLKEWLRIENSNSDQLLQRLVSEASQAAVTFMGRSPQSADYTETQNGTHLRSFDGGSQLVMSQWPITAVSSVTVDGIAVPPRPSLPLGNPAWGFTFDNDTVYLTGYRFHRGFQNCTIAYTAGYAAGSPDLMAIEQAVIEIASQRWARRTHIDQDSQNLQGMVVSFSKLDIPAEARCVLERYRRVW